MAKFRPGAKETSEAADPSVLAKISAGCASPTAFRWPVLAQPFFWSSEMECFQFWHVMGEEGSHIVDGLQLPHQGGLWGSKPPAMMVRWDYQNVTDEDNRRELLDANSLVNGLQPTWLIQISILHPLSASRCFECHPSTSKDHPGTFALVCCACGSIQE